MVLLSAQWELIASTGISGTLMERPGNMVGGIVLSHRSSSNVFHRYRYVRPGVVVMENEVFTSCGIFWLFPLNSMAIYNEIVIRSNIFIWHRQLYRINSMLTISPCETIKCLIHLVLYFMNVFWDFLRKKSSYTFKIQIIYNFLYKYKKK